MLGELLFFSFCKEKSQDKLLRSAAPSGRREHGRRRGVASAIRHDARIYLNASKRAVSLLGTDEILSRASPLSSSPIIGYSNLRAEGRRAQVSEDRLEYTSLPLDLAYKLMVVAEGEAQRVKKRYRKPLVILEELKKLALPHAKPLPEGRGKPLVAFVDS